MAYLLHIMMEAPHIIVYVLHIMVTTLHMMVYVLHIMMKTGSKGVNHSYICQFVVGV